MILHSAGLSIGIRARAFIIGSLLVVLAHSSVHGQSGSELRRLKDQFSQAMLSKNSAAIAAMFTEDGQVRWSGKPRATGKDKIQAHWETDIGKLAKFLFLESSVRSRNDSTAVESGRYAIAWYAPYLVGGTVRYEIIWRRTKDGWKIGSFDY